MLFSFSVVTTLRYIVALSPLSGTWLHPVFPHCHFSTLKRCTLEQQLPNFLPQPWQPGFCFCGPNKVCSQFHTLSQLGIKNIWGISCTFIDRVQIMFPYHCSPANPCNAHMIFTFGITSNLQMIPSIRAGECAWVLCKQPFYIRNLSILGIQCPLEVGLPGPGI